MADEVCTCLTDESVRDIVREDAREFMRNFANNYGDQCTKMIEVAAQEHICRLIHILVMMEEADAPGHEDGADVPSMERCQATYQRVEDRLVKLARGIQPFVSKAMYDIELEKNGARH